jgi:geranylgeranyl diphosphate synthase, type II
MLIHLLQSCRADEQSRLIDWLGLKREQRLDADVRWVQDRMLHYASLDYARRVAHALAGAALYEFKGAYAAAPPSRDKQFIEALPYWVLERA